MFNPEHLLGQMLGHAMSGQLGGSHRKRKPNRGMGLPTGTQVKIGMGLLGVAIAAFEHYRDKPVTPTATSPAPMPPPPPTHFPAPPPPPTAAPVNAEHAMHLLRAMITAADADGLVDAQERQTLISRAQEAGLSSESLRALDAEMSAPLTLNQLVARTPETLRDEVYAAALIAITADTDAERQFLDQLASRLGLDAGSRHTIHQQLGLN